MSSQFPSLPSYHSRKRSAPDSPFSSHTDKKHRPNLATGFSGLSIGYAARCDDVHAVDPECVEEESLEQPVSELGVEEVDTSSTSSSEGTVDSDSTFRNTRPKRRRKRLLQPDTVEHPTETDEQVRPDETPHPPASYYARRMHELDMDVDEDMEEMPRKSRRRNRTQWHEPEKDRECDEGRG
jgi:hypothetical protein